MYSSSLVCVGFQSTKLIFFLMQKMVRELKLPEVRLLSKLSVGYTLQSVRFIIKLIILSGTMLFVLDQEEPDNTPQSQCYWNLIIS